MSKLRCDSVWNNLTPEQTQTLEHWLFVENQGYKQTCERVQKEWGITSSLWGVRRFYQRRINQRTLGEITEGQGTAGEVNGTETKLGSLRSASWKVLATRVLDKVMAADDVKDLAALGRLLTESERTEIHRGRLALARERFEFKSAEAALAQLSKLDEINQEDMAREKARVHAIKVHMFGKNLPE